MAEYPNNLELLVSASNMKSFGVLDMNDDEHVLLPITKRIQDGVIHNILGTVLLEKLLTLIRTDEIVLDENAIYKQMLDGYIFHIMAWAVRAEYAVETAIKSRNFGTGTSNDSYLQNSILTDVFKIRDYYKSQSDKYVLEFGEWLCGHADEIPELSFIENWWEKKPLNDTQTSDFIYFPDKNRCRRCER